MEKLSTINAIVDLLEAQLKPDRISALVRRSAPAYGERSILEAVAAGDEELEGEEAAKAGVIQRDLSIHMHNSYAANRLGIERLALFLQAASGLLTLEIFSWILAIATGT